MHRLDASFRDPSGFLYVRDGVLLRHVAKAYASDYDQLMSSGLYAKLVESGLLVAHDELNPEDGAYRTLRPERVPFVSYPYEWCFGMLRQAALATLRIHRIALEHGMSLKDASAYNIQFVDGRAVLIDTLSFERAKEGAPWVAYRQFCQHFLAPLALMAYRDPRLNLMLREHIDGLPLDLAVPLLPWRTRLKPGLAMHLHAHARAQRAAAKKTERQARPMSARAMEGLLGSLRGAVRGLGYEPGGTEWGDYYDQTNYSDDAAQEKERLVREMLEAVRPQSVWDLGANDGRYSRLASESGAMTVAFDIDPAAVEQGYRFVRKQKLPRLLNLRLDLANPSPGLGWAHGERDSLLSRGPADCVMALALVHHLAIGNNVPWPQIAHFFASAGRNVIVEFVPKSDSQVQRMLATREDVFDDYDVEHFEQAFLARFELLRKEAIAGSERTLYCLRRTEDNDV